MSNTTLNMTNASNATGAPRVPLSAKISAKQATKLERILGDLYHKLKGFEHIGANTFVHMDFFRHCMSRCEGTLVLNWLSEGMHPGECPVGELFHLLLDLNNRKTPNVEALLGEVAEVLSAECELKDGNAILGMLASELAKALSRGDRHEQWLYVLETLLGPAFDPKKIAEGKTLKAKKPELLAPSAHEFGDRSKTKGGQMTFRELEVTIQHGADGDEAEVKPLAPGQEIALEDLWRLNYTTKDPETGELRLSADLTRLLRAMMRPYFLLPPPPKIDRGTMTDEEVENLMLAHSVPTSKESAAYEAEGILAGMFSAMTGFRDVGRILHKIRECMKEIQPHDAKGIARDIERLMQVGQPEPGPSPQKKSKVASKGPGPKPGEMFGSNEHTKNARNELEALMQATQQKFKDVAASISPHSSEDPKTLKSLLDGISSTVKTMEKDPIEGLQKEVDASRKELELIRSGYNTGLGSKASKALAELRTALNGLKGPRSVVYNDIKHAQKGLNKDGQTEEDGDLQCTDHRAKYAAFAKTVDDVMAKQETATGKPDMEQFKELFAGLITRASNLQMKVELTKKAYARSAAKRLLAAESSEVSDVEGEEPRRVGEKAHRGQVDDEKAHRDQVNAASREQGGEAETGLPSMPPTPSTHGEAPTAGKSALPPVALPVDDYHVVTLTNGLLPDHMPTSMALDDEEE